MRHTLVVTRQPSSLLALDIGGTTIKGGVVCASAGTAPRSWPTPLGPDATLHAVLAALHELADSAGVVRGIGIASPGIVDEDRGVIEFWSSVGWRNVALADLVATEFGVQVAVVQDTNAAARAEHAADPTLRGNFAFVGLGTGIGAAILLDGVVVRGRTGRAGELGHIRISSGTRECLCGAIGCLDTVAAGWGLRRRYARRTGRDLTVSEIVTRLDTDPVAAKVWRDGCAALGEALAALVLIADPGPIVLGGGLSLAQERLLGPVQAAFVATSPLVAGGDVRLSRLGAGGSLAGALLAAEQLR